MVHSVHIINRYAETRHHGKIQCTIMPGKGRVLIATKPFKCGETIFIEPQLRAVLADDSNILYQQLCKWKKEYNFPLEPIWYWCAINCLITPSILETTKSAISIGVEVSGDATDDNSIRGIEEKKENIDDKSSNRLNGTMKNLQDDDTNKRDSKSTDSASALPLWTKLDVISEETRRKLEMLHKPDSKEISPEVEVLVDKLGLYDVITRQELENMLQIWVHNCFDYHEDPEGYAVYFMPSFFSHSCLPNAVWRLQEDNSYALGARLDIKAGEEITISYLDENTLLEPAYLRQHLIETTKDFICTCPRCTCPADLSRGFVCLQCEGGPIFLHPDSGTVRDQNLLDTNFPAIESPPDCSLPEYVLKLEELIDPDASLTKPLDIVNRLYSYRPFVCYTCGHKLKESELKRLLRREKRVMRFIKRWENQESEQEQETNHDEGDADETETSRASSIISQQSNEPKKGSNQDRKPVKTFRPSGLTQEHLAPSMSQSSDSTLTNEAPDSYNPSSSRNCRENNNCHENNKCYDSNNFRGNRSSDHKAHVESCSIGTNGCASELLNEVKHLEEKSNQYFKQHWILFRLENHFKEYFQRKNDFFHAIQRATRRLIFTQRMYFAISGVLSWVYDDLADLYLIAQWNYRPLVDIEIDHFTKEETERIALALYNEAYRLQCYLFTSSHEYTSEVKNKIKRYKDCVVAACKQYQIPWVAFTPPSSPGCFP